MDDVFEVLLLLQDQILKIHSELPLLIAYVQRQELLSILLQPLKDEGVEIKLRGRDDHIIKGPASILGVEVLFLGLVVGQCFRKWFVVVLLQGVDILSSLGTPYLDLLIIGRSHQDIFLLNVLQHLNRLVVRLHLPQ